MRLLLASVFGSLAALAVSTRTSSSCKCVPSDPCWPATAEWDSLNTTLSGRLIRSTPPGAVCYPSRPEYNATACDDVIAKWTSSSFHSADPISINGPVWANDSCNPIYPNGTSVTGDVNAGARGCSIGMYPPYVINVTEASDVLAGFKFAKRWNIRLNIKNTGHGAGRNNAFGSLSFWTHNLKDIQVHEDFKPQGSELNGTYPTAHMAATLGAGVQDGELFEAMAKKSLIAVGGTNYDVGVVGWATGGGHGLATGHYGMGADSIIEAVIVTPSEEVLTANEYQNSDIFWAIRGGGGGTFGVILSVTVRVYPMPSVNVLGLNVAAAHGTSSKRWYEFVADLHGLIPQAQDQGLHGYWSMGGDPAFSLVASFFLYDTTNETAKSIQAPLLDLLSKSNGTITCTTTPLWFSSWYSLVKTLPVIEHVGTTKGVTASRLISRKTVTENKASFARLLEELGPRSTESLDGIPNFTMSGTMTISKTHVENALNPAWREAAVHLISSRSWDYSLNASIANEIVEDMTYNRLNMLRELEPNSGAYFNEANSFEPGWQWSFFGPNYGRLRSIKAKYDPEGLLWCNQCVGSEDWVQNKDGLLCRLFEPLVSQN
ncbi:hypothetical protein F5Y04DRAFT_252178 [Hypomontagnella monticulosa]|nr:hypothetical protein F5Y04DRAFT_252178 [Hypomontagnella monticulosa]